jgi:hypothetical protein
MVVTQKAGALLIGANIGLQQAREQIIALAAQHKMPTVFWDSASAWRLGPIQYMAPKCARFIARDVALSSYSKYSLNARSFIAGAQALFVS